MPGVPASEAAAHLAEMQYSCLRSENLANFGTFGEAPEYPCFQAEGHSIEIVVLKPAGSSAGPS
jgi:hypothetical protein